MSSNLLGKGGKTLHQHQTLFDCASLGNISASWCGQVTTSSFTECQGNKMEKKTNFKKNTHDVTNCITWKLYTDYN